MPAGTRLGTPPSVLRRHALFGRLLALGVLLCSALGSPCFATAPAPPQVSISAFKPTQMEIGKMAVRSYVAKWKAEARASGMRFSTYAGKVLAPDFAKEVLPAIIDPDGVYRNTDGHHRITALLEVSRQTGVQFSFGVRLLKDYRGWKFDDYANHFVRKLAKGQFTTAVSKLGPTERMQHLPNDYGSLKNNPLRSTFEAVFADLGIKGGMMRDYIDFRAAQKLLDRGLIAKLAQHGIVDEHARTVPAKLAMDDKLVKFVEHQLGKDKMKKFLLDNALDRHGRKLIRRALNEI